MSQGLTVDKQPSIERLADALQGRQLATPAIFVLEMLKPWRFVASQMLIMTQPMWGNEGRDAVRQYADWLDTPGGIEAVQQALEQPRADKASQT